MKTFITAILCIWANNILAFSPIPTTIHWPEVRNVQQRHHRKQPSHHSLAMSEKDFQFLFNTIKKKSFDDDRMELLSVGVLDNHFTCRQCVRLMSLYRFDDDKLKIVRIMAGHIIDLENHHDILKLLDFDSGRQKAIDILGIKHKKNGVKF